MEIYNETYCVYIHTNKINGKKYVGQTIHGDNPKKRWRGGSRYNKQPYFYHAIQKYGWDNFEHEIIASNLTLEEANNFESLLIEKLDLMNPDKGYNLRSGGAHSRLSESTKEKLRQIGLRQPPMSGETRKKISDKLKGRKKTPEHIMRVVEANKGFRHSEESKKKMSETRKGKQKSGENPHARGIIQLDNDWNFIKEYPCLLDANRETGISDKNICSVSRGNRPRAGGFRWMYSDEYYSKYIDIE